MSRLSVWVSVACVVMAVVGNGVAAEPELSAAQIVEKNVAARGGPEAWRKIQTMVWIGHIERASANAPNLPYVFEQKRPNKTRFEIMAKSQVGTRIFDGVHGWKVHPASNGGPVLEPYTAEELDYAREAQGIDGELVDYQAKGITVTLDGVDDVEGRQAYRLTVRKPSGASHHVWIDAQSFLDVKYDRPPHYARLRNAQPQNAPSQNALRGPGTVTVFYRNYQTIEGLQIPLLIESGADPAKAVDKMVIDKVMLNPPMPDQRFAQPAMPAGGRALGAEGVPVRAFRPTRLWPEALPRSGSRQLPASTGRQ